MTRRLPDPDQAPLRGGPLEIVFAGERVRAFEGESVAAALFASGTRVLSRSLKYHRPRSFFCMSGHCGGCLVRIDGVPNLRACQTPCSPGLEVAAQNAYPSADIDLLEAVDWFFPRGMNHHTLMTGSKVLNAVANKVVRQLSGLGELPDRAAEAPPPVRAASPDVVVVGGGPAGLAAATAAARRGARTLLVDEQPITGGSLLVDPRHGGGVAAKRVAAARAAGVEILAGGTAIAYFPEDDGGVLAVATAHGLLRITARCHVYATGGYPVNLLFGNNDRPGVLAARAVGRLLVQHGVLAGERIVVVGSGGHEEAAVGYVAALCRALSTAGAEVVAIDQVGTRVLQARGRNWVKAVDVRGPDGKERRIDCDAVAVAAVPAPASEAPRQHGCAVELDPARGGFRVVVHADGRTSVDGVLACGDVCGYVGPDAAARHGERVGETAAAVAAGRS
jgi:NADPH-dependent 2,4-dienoyl-CoA reductase/sulfur reductase-like enzyme